jgi:hypothetical protein
MIAIENTLISEEILDQAFVCDLAKCKGACCVEGDAGAPVEEKEGEILQHEYENIRPFLRPEGRAAIEEQGTTVVDEADNELVTPLVNGAECAYVVFDEKGVTKCGIEKAWEAGATHFRKPVSCHLYPIRITKYPTYQAVNYHQWQICSPACDLGNQLKVPVYLFAKEALLRKYGENWFAELEVIAKNWPA